MKRCAKFFAILALIGTLGSISIAGEKKGVEKKKEPKKSSSGLNSIPVGHGGNGIKVPMRDAAGKLQLVFYIEAAQHVDTDHFEMKNTKVETYDDSEALEMTIDLLSSVLDLSTKIITSKQPVTIRRSDFEVTGESMRYNTTTRQGKMFGKVRMLIYNGGEMTSPDKTK